MGVRIVGVRQTGRRRRAAAIQPVVCFLLILDCSEATSVLVVGARPALPSTDPRQGTTD